MFEILLGRGEAGFFQSLANDDVKVNKAQRISTKIDRFRTRRPFVNLDTGTSALELELELIQQTQLFPVPLGQWTPNLAGW